MEKAVSENEELGVVVARTSWSRTEGTLKRTR